MPGRSSPLPCHPSPPVLSYLQQGIQQGARQELLEDIELGSELKFGSEGLKILPEIYKIKDVDRLRAIRGGLKVVHSLEELRRIFQ